MRIQVLFLLLTFAFLNIFVDSASNYPSSTSSEDSDSSQEESTGGSEDDESDQAAITSGTKLSVGATSDYKATIKSIIKKKPMGLPNQMAKWIANFLVKNAVLLIIVEFESKLLNLNTIILSDIWLMLNNFSVQEHSFIKGLVNFWDESNVESPNQIVVFMLKSTSLYKRFILKDYGNTALKSHNLLLQNLNQIDCLDLKTLFALIILSFEQNEPSIFSVLLLFLLVCSARDIYGNSFKEKLEFVVRNENNSASLLSIIGGNDVNEQLKIFYELLISSKMPTLPSTSPVMYPINMNIISVEEFGNRLCNSLLELALLSELNFMSKYLLLFFVSRMAQASEVFLALDIYNIIAKKTSDTKAILSAFLYDHNLFSEVVKKVFKSHYLDVSNLKANIQSCLKKKEQHSILREIKIETDYQAKTRKKRLLKKKV